MVRKFRDRVCFGSVELASSSLHPDRAWVSQQCPILSKLLVYLLECFELGLFTFRPELFFLSIWRNALETVCIRLRLALSATSPSELARLSLFCTVLESSDDSCCVAELVDHALVSFLYGCSFATLSYRMRSLSDSTWTQLVAQIASDSTWAYLCSWSHLSSTRIYWVLSLFRSWTWLP